MKKLIAFALLVVSVGSLGQSSPSDSGLTLEGGWIALPPPNARAVAGYGTLHNQSAETITIDHIWSPDFESAMLHQSVEIDGVVTMGHLESITLESGESHEFVPGGAHLMLMQPRRALEEGLEVDLEFCHQGAPVLTTRVEVRRR